MNHGASEAFATARNPRNTTVKLDTLKRERMKAEERLTNARAIVVSTEIDIEVLSTQLKAVAKLRKLFLQSPAERPTCLAGFFDSARKWINIPLAAYSFGCI